MKTRCEPTKASRTTTCSRRGTSSPFFSKSRAETGAAAPASLAVQTKLRTSEPGDRFEREADSMADLVVEGGATEPASAPLISRVSPFVQTKPDEDVQPQANEREEDVQAQVDQREEDVQAQADEREEDVQAQADEREEDVQAQADEREEDVQAQADEREEDVQAQADEPEEDVQAQVDEREEDVQPQADEREEDVQAQADEREEDVQAQADEREEDVQARSNGAPGAAPPEFEPGLRAARGRGSPLRDGVRHRMEAAFGADFGPVRVHTDGAAANLARMVGAKAFAHGRDLFFGQDQFSPGTRTGEHLLAHELTHTIQQDAVGSKAPGAAGPATATPAPQPASTVTPDDTAQAEVEPTAALDEAAPTADVADTAAAEPDVAIDLPAPAAPAPEAIAPVALAGSSAEAMTAFTDARPSQMATSLPDLGPTLGGKIGDEKAAEATNAPVLTAKTSGTVDEGLTPAEELAGPGPAALDEGVTGPEPATLEPEPHENAGAAPSNAESTKLLDRQGQDLEALRGNMAGFMAAVETTDDGVNTSAGARPNVQLAGESDPGRMDAQRAGATAQLASRRDATTDSIKHHPGQQNIQPKAVDSAHTVAIGPEPAVAIDAQADQGAADYAAAPLAPEVRSKADDLLETSLHANLADARAKTNDAARQREAEKSDEVRKAETATAEANAKADADQRDVVVANRTEVAKQQKAGIENAHAEVAAFDAEASKEQTAARQSVSEKVTDTEGKAGAELEKGEAAADKKKTEGEQEAAAKKRSLEQDQKNDSWWSRAVDAVKSAVKAITSAIDAIFTKIRDAVKTLIDKAKQAAIGLINAARTWIVDKLNKFRDWAKGMVDTFLKDRFPRLAAAINAGIDAVVDTAVAGVNAVADAAIATVEALANALAAVLDKILSVYQTALKAAVQIAGAVLTGDFAGALRIAIQAACDIAGVDSKPIFDFIDRAAASVMKILKEPGTFFNNLVTAVGDGVRHFVKNIKQHLIKGLIGWLTGALSEGGITLPDKFDFKGILSLVLQILGLTYDNIKARVIKKFPKAAKVFDLVEKGFDIVKRLVTEGPIALWEEIKAKLSNLKEMVMSGIRDFIITTVIKEGVVWIISLLNPAGALAKIAKLLFDFVMFLVERFQQIKDFVLSVYESITAIASGALSKATQAVEDALARSVPVVISLFASLLGLGGIGKTIKKIIGKVTTPINKAIDKVIDKIVAFAKKLLKKGQSAAKKVKEKLFEWWKVKTSFKAADGTSHSLYLKGSGESATLMLKSKETMFKKFLDEKSPTPEEKADHAAARKALADFEDVKKKKAPKDIAADKKKKQLETHLGTLKKHVGALVGDDLPAWQAPKYGGLHGSGFGASMRAEVLTMNGLEYGSPPKDAGGNWTTINERRQSGGASYYIRGHLLNDNLGGPGVWKNMTPLSRVGNSKHEKEVESDVKKAAAAGGIVQYDVIPSYKPRSDRAALRARVVEGRTSDDATTLEAIVDAEDFVPTGLSITARTVEKARSGFKPLKTLYADTLPNPVDRDPASYHLSGSKKLAAVAVDSNVKAAQLTAFGGDLSAAATTLVNAATPIEGEPAFKSFRTYAELSAATDPNIDTTTLRGWSKKKWIRLTPT